MIDIAINASEPADAVTSLIKASNEKWLNKETIIDDTTVCVIFLSGLNKLDEKSN